MRRYAEGTTVSVEKSRAEIEGLALRYGATHFSSGYGPGKATIEFAIKNYGVRFILPLPLIDEKRFKWVIRRGLNQAASEDQKREMHAQECRRRWRALCLCIKAKLETVESGITTFEHEFLAHIVDPVSLKTVGEVFVPQIGQRQEGRPFPLALPAPDEIEGEVVE